MVSEEITRNILKRLKFDNDTLNKVKKLVIFHDYYIPATAQNVRRAINKIGEDLFPYYIEVRRADIMAQSEREQAEKLQHLKEIEAIYHEIIEREQCVSLKTLAVSGKDLIQAGMKPGKELGITLAELLEVVLDDPEMNKKERLLEYLAKRDRDI